MCEFVYQGHASFVVERVSTHVQLAAHVVVEPRQILVRLVQLVLRILRTAGESEGDGIITLCRVVVFSVRFEELLVGQDLHLNWVRKRSTTRLLNESLELRQRARQGGV